MNLTLSAETEVISGARAWALAHGTTINALVREYLASLGTCTGREEAARLFFENARKSSGRSMRGSRFDRNELYEGKRFGTGKP